ncbi:MAG: hypothetical protein P4L91_01555 [Burkholderiaceae bacterium]|nr:hypothetical protein [Burkholderiaceae bacterium]
MTLKDILRTLFGIRVKREPPPLDRRPLAGSNVVRDNVRIRLKHLISDEQWEWFAGHGWRVTDMRTDRRRYLCVPEKALVKLLKADRHRYGVGAGDQSLLFHCS